MSKTVVVVDTSVIMKWLSSDNEQCLGQANAILKDVQNEKIELFAPELAKYEVENVLLLGKKLSPQQAQIAQGEFYNLPITFITESLNAAKVTFSLASTLGITYYDAAFLSLAKQYNASLVTENIKHQGKTNEVKVIPLKDYYAKVA
ncbi:hypothetical protein A3A63_02925 [Candidatus Gottesmanbacteria bacterium RIFCSPLOWO2_01_FULL_46_9]|uniref:PIN domain-containing protein n=1 Tax=Candidatus Gottesmanbacteria bacterium RIFCSPLOWO2_01_FULL_46_9 TaxID=1798394 RepID=A0A1F6B0C0_9BACT|nr:MAG: hypothetical protein A3A63_02925 [Candidatus Gottesmanbacteria bacterium RIFCSPLOWO2_01_FULL_46_9]